MENLILAVHYVVCLFLIIIILLQAGKGADIGAVFGGGSGTVFGSRGAATFLSKLTTAMAVVFLLTSISLAYISRKGQTTILKAVPETELGPAAGATPEPAPEKAPQAPEASKPTNEEKGIVMEPVKKQPTPEEGAGEKEKSGP